MHSAVVARPFTKWAGGKTALLPEILPRLPKKIKTYYEPFVGGGAVFFALANEGRFDSAMLGDANEELMNTYSALSNNVSGIVRALKEHVYEKAHYYTVRAQRPVSLSVSARAARFIYLNRTCFNGLYRVNRKGEFNVPFGRYTNPTICDEENLRSVGKLLRGPSHKSGSWPDWAVYFSWDDFESTMGGAIKGDAVYCDPPYWPVSATSNFTAYGKDGFGPKDQERLRDTAKHLIDRGVHVLLSNSDTPFVRKLYKGFKIEKVQAPRRINSKGGKRGDVGELLISGRL